MTDVAVRLAPISLGVAHAMIELRNDPTVQAHVRNPGLLTTDDQSRWCNWLHDHRAEVRMFAIEHDIGGQRDDVTDEPWGWQLVGCCGLTGIDWQNRRAELSVYTVPATHELVAGQILLLHAFHDLGLHKVEAETITLERKGLVEELGFECEGIRRDAYWRAGKWIESFNWGLTA